MCTISRAFCMDQSLQYHQVLSSMQKTLLYLGVYHANTNEEKTKVTYARRESNLILINYGEMVYHKTIVFCNGYNVPMLFNVHGS